MRRSPSSAAAAIAFALALAPALVIPIRASAQGALSISAERIIELAEEGEDSSTSRIVYEMSVREGGRKEARSFRLMILAKGEEASMAEFQEPRTVKGLRILSLGDETWVHFPSTGRTRKISGSSRSGSVQGIGGDFSYEDMDSGRWSADYSFAIRSEDGSSWTLEGKPKKQGGSYDAIRMRVEKEGYRVVRIDFSAPGKGWYKELALAGYKAWGTKTRASRLTMRDLVKGSSTELVIAEATFDAPIDERWFSPERFSK